MVSSSLSSLGCQLDNVIDGKVVAAAIGDFELGVLILAEVSQPKLGFKLFERKLLQSYEVRFFDGLV